MKRGPRLVAFVAAYAMAFGLLVVVIRSCELRQMGYGAAFVPRSLVLAKLRAYVLTRVAEENAR